MIDLRVVRADPDAARASQIARGEDPQAIDRLLEADVRRRAAVDAASRLRADAKAASEAVRAAPDKAVAAQAAKSIKEQVIAAEDQERAADAALLEAHVAVPNLIGPGVPPGGEANFVVHHTPAQLPSYPPDPQDHTDIGERLGLIDTARGAKVSGARFAFLTGAGALLELALVQLAMQRAIAAGFTPMVPPALVKPESMEGTGFLGAHAAEVYRLREDDLYLVGTSEVPLAAYHRDEILEALPLRYAGFSSCFRREAGSYGKDTRGIIRVHQFDKVEMFSYIPLADAHAEHERLLATERAFLDELELPYRVIEVAAGDLGSSASRKYDCEVWLPSQQRWLELTSTSNCTDFQARRLGIRHRVEGRSQHVATLNGTLCAIGRTIVALLETHQQADGSVAVPEALRPALALYGVGATLS